MRAAEATTVIFVVTLRQDAGHNISGENFQGLREKLRKMGSHGERVCMWGDIIIIIVFLYKNLLPTNLNDIFDAVHMYIYIHRFTCIAFKLVQKQSFLFHAPW